MSGTSGTVLVPASIDPSGQADVTAKLQAVINGAPNGYTILWQPFAVYRCEGRLLLNGRQRLKIDLNRGQIKATIPEPYTVAVGGVPARALNQQRAAFSLINCVNVRITNGTIRGANTPNSPSYFDTRAFQHAVNVQGGSGHEFDHLTVRDMYGDFFAFDPLSGTVQLAQHFHVHDCDCSGAGRQGISFAGCTDGLIENNRFALVRRHTLDFESDRPFRLGTEPIQRIVVRANRFEGGVGLGFMSIGGLGAIVTDITIGGLTQADGNTLAGKAMDILLALNGEPAIGNLPARPAGRPKNILIGWNTSDTPHGQPAPAGLIKAVGVDGLTVIHNSPPPGVTPVPNMLQLGRGNVGVYMIGCTARSVHDNNFTGAVAESLTV